MCIHIRDFRKHARVKPGKEVWNCQLTYGEEEHTQYTVALENKAREWAVQYYNNQ